MVRKERLNRPLNWCDPVHAQPSRTWAPLESSVPIPIDWAES